jgi:pimeloyl-ACP methyl ester carboxylesterase
MLHVREYGASGATVIVLHGGPGAAGHMAPVARDLSGCYRVIEPFQRRSGGEKLTVARHVADLHEVVQVFAGSSRPGLVGASWGAMLALAYASAHPGSSGPLVLVGCGTFDPAARSHLERRIAKRMTDDIRAELEQAAQLAPDERLKATARAMNGIYSYDPISLPHQQDEIDAQGRDETWEDMLRLQENGTYPGALSTIDAPVLMVHGAFDPHPGRLVFTSLQPFVPQIEYRELERCGHYPWLERTAADTFFSVVRGWLREHMRAP